MIAALALGVLTSCAPLDIYYKPGVSVARLTQQTTACEVAALRDAPVANETRQDPPQYVPPRKYCNSNGDCYREPGYWLQGRIYTVDTNAGLRNRVETQCMANKGFTPVQIPVCPAGIKSTGATTVLPNLTKTSCVIRNKDGTVQIVNRR
jgi:hypothetical protein